MSLSYIGNVAYAQVKPLSWGKEYTGEPDSVTKECQGAQYLEAAFIAAQTAYQTLVATDSAGANLNDSNMFLVRVTSDNDPVAPTVALHYMGCKGGVLPSPLKVDDRTIQSASTTHTITDATSPNGPNLATGAPGKAITLSVSYLASRTTYRWTTLSSPGTTPTYTTVRDQVVPTLTNLIERKFSGMVDTDGNPTDYISTADATAVWNSFTAGTRITSYNRNEVVPSKLWTCEVVAEYVLTGT